MIILAWMDDWQMSAKLAKLSTDNAYQLIFYERGLQFRSLETQRVLIIDIWDAEGYDLEQVTYWGKDDSAFIIGYAYEMDGIQRKTLRKLGFDMVLRRSKLLNNLDAILKKITNAV